jgi:hypothetical protein
MVLPAEGTLLILSDIGVPLYSARGLTQTLTPIQQASDLRRDINGNLVDLSLPQFQKYATEVTCKDRRAPALDGIWPGHIISISCVTELSYPNGGAAARPAVPGSEYIEGGFTFYRPIIRIRVKDINLSGDEWPSDYAWKLGGEEI